MKIIYSKENAITGKVCIAIGVVNLLFIPADLLFNDANLVSVYYFFLFVAVLMGAGAWIIYKDIKTFRNEREFIVSNGYECRGEVIDYIRRKRNDKRYTNLRIRYHSQILGREITFDTDSLDIKLEKKDGVYCTVYETHATELKRRQLEKINSAFGISGKIEGSDPDFEPQELSYMADTLENAEIRKTKLSDVLFVIIFLLFLQQRLYGF